MTIKVGDRIPAVVVKTLNDGIRDVSTDALFANLKVVLFSVPGAFTPTCSTKHLPGYVANLAKFAARGVGVACMAVNDAFVMSAWAEREKVPASLQMLADGNAAFARAMGLEMDGTAFGMGLRSRRFALYAEDGVVRQLHIEAPGELRVSTAEAMLEVLG